MRRARLWAALAITAVVGTIGLAQLASPPADAATAGNFYAGNIISEQKFHDTSTMSTGQVQSFLEMQVGRCAAGAVCLKDYRQSTWTRGADAECSGYAAGTVERASLIISKVAAACGINPQVLLVLLQKEQTLVSSASPGASQYAKATGYACPDTAPCSAQFSGFYNQVYKAAWQFRYYENHSGSYRYKKNTVANIQLHPSASCGTQAVYIENQATANLYNYTPYVPNAAALSNMYGTGNSCSAYGNRNFWRIFTDWFGSTTGPKNVHGALDSAEGVTNGIQLAGWAVDPYTKASTHIQVSIDGRGQAVAADKALSWITGLYPGYGNNHGYNTIVGAAAGDHRVCVSQANGTSLGCANVSVPKSDTATGVVDSAVAVAGGVRVKGWAVNLKSAGPTYIWINVDGAGSAYQTSINLPWTGGLYPGTGILHGFDVTIPTTPGPHRVCTYSPQALLSCEKITVAHNEVGAIESAVGVVGGVSLSGYSLDQRSTATTYVWASVDGQGKGVSANGPSATSAAAYPAAGKYHGFTTFLAAAPGPRTVCANGTAENTSYGCRTVVVPPSEVGAFDSVAGTFGTISVSGWSLDQRDTRLSYVWVSIDGAGGGPLAARNTLGWIAGAFPASGPNHGYGGQFAATPGKHSVCIMGTAEGNSYGCKTVTVPNREVGAFDSATGVVGGIDITGWSLDQTSNNRSYIWVTVDGKDGSAAAAKTTLGWIAGLYPTAGPDHGFNTRVPATAGAHRICVNGTQEGVAYGCKSVTVQERYPATVDAVTPVPGGVRITGWAVDVTSRAIQDIWVDVDGVGRAVRAATPLSWIGGYFPGVGPNHGINAFIETTPGNHRVCLTVTADNRSLGCSTVATD